MNLKEIQKQIYQNKLDKSWNVTNIEEEFCHLYGEVSEAYEAYRQKKDDLGEELADVAIYLLGLAEILKIDLGEEIKKKVEKNKKRVYKNINGVSTRIEG